MCMCMCTVNGSCIRRRLWGQRRALLALLMLALQRDVVTCVIFRSSSNTVPFSAISVIDIMISLEVVNFNESLYVPILLIKCH